MPSEKGQKEAYLARQKKVYQELSQRLGSSGNVSSEDLSRMAVEQVR